MRNHTRIAGFVVAVFGVLTLVTGSIWAKASWGVWWTWSERQLVLFLVLFLFYSAYFMLRYSVDPGPRRANMSAVYALFGVVLIPVSFLAIRLAEGLIHPVVFDRDVGSNLAGSQLLTFVVCLAGMLALSGSLYVNELTGKRIDGVQGPGWLARLENLADEPGSIGALAVADPKRYNSELVTFTSMTCSFSITASRLAGFTSRWISPWRYT